MVFLEVMVVAA